jgi:hypothetical protein
MDTTDLLRMNDAYTWIATEKPDFEAFAMDSCRCSFIQYLLKIAPVDHDDAAGTATLIDISIRLEEEVAW